MYWYIHSYRSSEEVKDKRKNEDAIANLEEYAVQGNLITEEEMKASLLVLDTCVFFFPILSC